MESIIFDNIEFGVIYKSLQSKGFVAWEYNPFYNLRTGTYTFKKDALGQYLKYNSEGQEVVATLNGRNLTDEVLEEVLEGKQLFQSDSYGKINTFILVTSEDITDLEIEIENLKKELESSTSERLEELEAELKKLESDLKKLENLKGLKDLLPLNSDNKIDASVSKSNNLIIASKPGDLTDFTTNQLNLDTNHPVDILVQESYDGSINLILNDDRISKNLMDVPKLINSRFTYLEDGRYEIVDRVGSNDTNIYNTAHLSDDISLYKISTKLPEISLVSVTNGGILPVGNYVFYFKYADADGNETDFIGESSIVPIFKGTIGYPSSIHGGIEGEASDKMIRMSIANSDSSYTYLNVYYVRSAGSTNKTEYQQAFKVLRKYSVSEDRIEFTLTGYEEVEEISIDEINLQYNVVKGVKSQAIAQNRLFFGNVSKDNIDYEELRDLSLRITPKFDYSVENAFFDINENYEAKSDVGYYNPLNVYEKLSYWPEEFYRFGIVYILNDYTLSPVFNIRGGILSNESNTFTSFPIYNPDTKERNKIKLTDKGFINESSIDSVEFENGLGVVKLGDRESSEITPLGIIFEFDDGLREELMKYSRGFFIVRQKRIPTIYCQGIAIGLDANSHIPLLHDSGGYFTESFLNDDLVLDHDMVSRKIFTDESNANLVKVHAALIPDAELHSEYYSQIFSGGKFKIKILRNLGSVNTSDSNRHYYFNNYNYLIKVEEPITATITYIPEDCQLKSSGTEKFSSRAGEAETAYKFEFLGEEDRSKKARNLVRGIFGSYVGVEAEGLEFGDLFNVYIPGYSEINYSDYIQVRGKDTSPFYAISDRTSWDRFSTTIKCFRGDCYIGQYTHRMMRNFSDPEGPTNDVIIDPKTWKNNFSGSEDGALVIADKCALINRGDVNAVGIGHWVTMKLRSNINYALRCEDASNVSETALYGHPRTFYPHTYMSESGTYKSPEATLFNAGYSSTTSNRYNFVLPDIPYIKNNFSNRIMYSDISVNDSFRNGFRVFRGTNYMDYSIEYGYITKILEWYGNILVVFEHGVGIVPINEKVQTGSGEGGEVFLNSKNVLSSKPLMLSETFGSQWKDSIIASERYVYGVDTVGKKIWRTTGSSSSFELISDFKIQKFLNDNISLSERERSPIMGVRNVVSHFNKFKGDIMFTFFDDHVYFNNLGKEQRYKQWNLCFNEQLNIWITQYSWIPLISDNIYNVFFTYNKESGKNISGVANSWAKCKTSEGIVLEGLDSNTNVNFNGVEIPVKSDGTVDTDVKIGKLVYKDSEGIYQGTNFRIIESEFSDYFYIDESEILHFKNLDKANNPLNDSDKVDVVFEVRIKCDVIKISETSLVQSIPNSREETLYIRKSYIRFKEVQETDYSDHYEYLSEIQTGSWLWRHGQAGIFDKTEEIKPCKWYGEQHPFEFEFIVNDNFSLHKIFTNLDIISNKVFPEKLEYEIIGDSFEFATNDSDWDLNDYDNIKLDSYDFQFDGYEPKENFTGTIIQFQSDPVILSESKKIINYRDFPRATEFYKNPDLNDRITFRRTMKIKDIRDLKYGRSKGNTEYREDIFDIMLEPIRYNRVLYQENKRVLKINKNYSTEGHKDYKKLFGIPPGYKYKVHEIRPKDKFIKFRVKYKGDKLAVITALQTFYILSYS